jgi:O-antigen/teichoic acid export membrane protein
MRNEFIKQLKYGIPLGAARVMLLIIHFDKLIISYIFPIRTFTIYAIGCFDIPILPGLGHTIRDIMSLEMAPLIKDSKFIEAVSLWKTTCRRILLIIVPSTIFLFFYSNEIITTIFSTKYIESVPYFKVYIFIFMATIFDSEILFRIFAKSIQLMTLQFSMSLLSVVTTIVTAIYFGPLMALVAKLVITVFSLITMMYISSKFFKHSIYNFFPWKDGFLTTFISIIILIPIYSLSSNITSWNIISGLIGGALFFPTLLVILSKINIISNEEIKIVVNKLNILRGIHD